MSLLAETVFWLSLVLTFACCVAMVAVANNCCEREKRRRLIGDRIIQLRSYPPVDYFDLEQELALSSDGLLLV